MTLISGMHIEPLLAASYAIFLVAAAFVLEALARHAQRRSQRYEHSGFTYYRHMDLWECPAGQKLRRSEIDHERRVVRYRAAATTCNACSLKANCTDSNEGRAIERRLDERIGHELQRFHRGISLTLLLLAAVILATETVRYETPRELVVLGSLLIATGTAGMHLLTQFVKTRSDSRG